jgi:uncharacterized protein YdhG (YjbR/CyaY superfamily)
MDITITDDHTIAEVQSTFAEKFPFLKLVFFQTPAEDSNHYPEKNMIKDVNKTLREVRHRHTSGHVSINGHLKAETLEDLFRELYGLNVQVFRKSGNAWLKTTTTDDRTLAELNRLGEEMSESMPRENITELDTE